eukprot:9488390-Pyramimonas_sp.AAC.1
MSYCTAPRNWRKTCFLPLVGHCICVLRNALCFTTAIQSWGPKASPLIIRCTAPRYATSQTRCWCVGLCQIVELPYAASYMQPGTHLSAIIVLPHHNVALSNL